MKLTKSELKLVANINKAKSINGKALIGVVALLVVYFGLRYSGLISPSDVSFDLVIIAMTWAFIAPRFGVTPTDEQYKDLLQRYVNRDPEALRALAKRQEGSARVADKVADEHG